MRIQKRTIAIVAVLYVVFGAGAILYAKLHDFPRIPYGGYFFGVVSSVIILMKPGPWFELPRLSKRTAWMLTIFVVFVVFIFSCAIFKMLTTH